MLENISILLFKYVFKYLFYNINLNNINKYYVKTHCNFLDIYFIPKLKCYR